MARLAERLRPICDVCSSNAVIGKFYIEHLFTVNYIEMMKMKKETVKGPFLKKLMHCCNQSLFTTIPRVKLLAYF